MRFIEKKFVDIKPSSTLSINELSKKIQNQGKKVFKFGLGQSPFPVPTILVNELKKHAHSKDYLDVSGLYELRDCIAKYHTNKNKVRYNADDVLIGPGSKELLFQCQMVFDGITLLPSPSWVSYAPQANFLGKKILWLQTTAKENWHITANLLEETCKKNKENKLLILNSPNNPSGTSSLYLEELAFIAKKYELIIISDEIYAELDFTGNYHSITHFYPEGTIVSGGLSKWCGAGGWRLGTMIFPQNLSLIRKAIRSVASETFTSVSAPIQYAAVKAYKTNHNEFLKKCRKILNFVSSFLHEELCSVGIKALKPTGGFYILCDFSNVIKKSDNIFSDQELSNLLLQKLGVASLPGSDFGLEKEKMILRLAFVDFDGEKALKYLIYKNKLEISDYKELFPMVYEGLLKIKNWVLEKNI
ncbi:MAG: pyridoxal phosphate-dependent aminotransferase [Paracoccaceae bacterium]